MREGKGDKDRYTVVPERLCAALSRQLSRARKIHAADLALGIGEAWLPHALARKHPNAGREWARQYVFPAPFPSKDPRG